MRQKHCAIRPHAPAGLGFRQGQPDGDTAKIDRQVWDKLFDVNLNVAMLVSVLPIMRSQRQGSITHVSRVAAIASYPLIAYKTSKAALHEFVR
jgi:NAD(P)-dependent dehydrogenase (short-subunit alcohol dehydrogenase family)